VMNKPGRRMLAAIAMGFIWIAAWSAAGAIVARVPGFDSDLPFALLFAPFAFVGGVVFSGIVMFTERHRNVDRISLLPYAVWGAVIGLLLSVIFPYLRGQWHESVVFAPTLAIASAIAAAASVAMTRRLGLIDPRREQHA
jgi:ABC-type Na+ efflux pump permease subunit